MYCVMNFAMTREATSKGLERLTTAYSPDPGELLPQRIMGQYGLRRLQLVAQMTRWMGGGQSAIFT